MKKEFRVVDEKRQVVQITTIDERWYAFPRNDKNTGLPTFYFLPSVTWICEYYPKGIAFYKWLADKGWNEAEALKVAAGDKGSKVHQAITDLLDGRTVEMTSGYVNPSLEVAEPLTISEYEGVLSFVAWHKEVKPSLLFNDFVVINETEQYAGMVDSVWKIDGELFLIDFKTSQYIWPSHELQISAYKHADTPLKINLKTCKLAILQLGYYRNKRRWKFTEIADKYDEFLAAKTIWANETRGAVPSQKDLPLSVSLTERKDDATNK